MRVKFVTLPHLFFFIQANNKMENKTKCGCVIKAFQWESGGSRSDGTQTELRATRRNVTTNLSACDSNLPEYKFSSNYQSEKERETFGHKTKANVRIWAGTESRVSGRKASLASRVQFDVQSFTYTDNFDEQPEGRGRKRDKDETETILAPPPSTTNEKLGVGYLISGPAPFIAATYLKSSEVLPPTQKASQPRPRQNIYTWCRGFAAAAPPPQKKNKLYFLNI